MADYDLTQTGQEVQDILDGAAMQTDLTAETQRAELAEQTLQGGIDAEETRAKAAEKQNADDIDVIESKIPAGASDQNQLADKEFVNNSIATATATYRGAYNLVNDLSLTVGATHEQIATALAGAISTADNNDYCFVQIPTADATPTQIASIERYKFNGAAWAYEYTLNNSGFTAAQWAALNSGITSGLVAKLLALPTNDALALALAGKQNVLTFDSVPVDGSNNPVKSGGVYSAIGDEETRAKAAEKANADDIDDIEALIPATASDENQLADKEYVNSSISTATATYRGSFNEVNDLSLNTDATHEQIATALAGAISTADNNDYCFVQIPTSDAAPTQIASIERYKFNGTAWAYEYTLNNSGFTAAQWAALNSGITSGLVAKLSALPTNDALTLALAGKQDVLTFDNEPTSGSNNPVKSGGVYDAIDVEATTRAAAIAAIVALIPEAASALNQLADKSFVNSSISTATAVFKGTFNVVVDLELSYNATQEQIATMLASKIISADNNDYCFVQIPTSDAAPLQIARTDRYKFNGTVWAYEYTLNNSGFTTAQWAAINSGITSLLKDKLIDLPTATELTALLAAKQNQLTFDTTPTTGSTNPVTSGGIKSAIDAEKARAEAAEADRYTKSETYNKTEINGMVSTPHQNYVTVPTYASLPSSGQSTDTIYRVSSYDGANNQVDDTVYSEYAWDGTQYVFLRVNSQIEEIFDITVYNNNTKYADLSAALGVDGANIPATLRRGGMSVKFVQSSDNKYVQYRLMSDSFNTTITNWQGIDEKPVVGSKNLVKSGGVAEILGGTSTQHLGPSDYANKIWAGDATGVYYSSASFNGFIIPLMEGIQYTIENVMHIVTFASIPNYGDTNKIRFLDAGTFVAQNGENYALATINLGQVTEIDVFSKIYGLIDSVEELESDVARIDQFIEKIEPSVKKWCNNDNINPYIEELYIKNATSRYPNGLYIKTFALSNDGVRFWTDETTTPNVVTAFRVEVVLHQYSTDAEDGSYRVYFGSNSITPIYSYVENAVPELIGYVKFRKGVDIGLSGVAYEIDRTIVSNINNSPSIKRMLEDDRQIVLLGDSHYGYPLPSILVDVIQGLTGIKTYNLGFGGCRMAWRTNDGSDDYDTFCFPEIADAIVSQNFTRQIAKAGIGMNYRRQVRDLQEIDITKPFQIVLNYSANDVTGGTALGNLFSVSTGWDISDDTKRNALLSNLDRSKFNEAFIYGLVKLFNAFPTKMNIQVHNEPWRWYSDSEEQQISPFDYRNSINLGVLDYRNALKENCELMGIRYVDYANAGITNAFSLRRDKQVSGNLITGVGLDGSIHMESVGCAMVAQRIVHEIRNYYQY